MARAGEDVVRPVELDGTTRMGADGREGPELAPCYLDDESGDLLGRIGEAGCTSYGHVGCRPDQRPLRHLCNRACSRGRSAPGSSRDCRHGAARSSRAVVGLVPASVVGIVWAGAGRGRGDAFGDRADRAGALRGVDKPPNACCQPAEHASPTTAVRLAAACLLEEDPPLGVGRSMPSELPVGPGSLQVWVFDPRVSRTRWARLA